MFNDADIDEVFVGFIVIIFEVIGWSLESLKFVTTNLKVVALWTSYEGKFDGFCVNGSPKLFPFTYHWYDAFS